MMKPVCIVFMSLIILAGCTNMVRFTAEEGYYYIYHFVENSLGRIFITSGHHNAQLDFLPADFDQINNFELDGRLTRSWADISLFRYSSAAQCLDQDRKLNDILDQLLANNILPDSDILLNVYLVPEQQFHVRKRATRNQEFDFYFPIDLCEREPALHSLAEISDKLVHEAYHIQIQRLSFWHRPKFSKQIEEDNAYLLGYCNWVTADAQTVLNKKYFVLDYDEERKRIQNAASTKVQKTSELGNLDAMERMHRALAEDELLKDFCLANIERINHQTFGS